MDIDLLLTKIEVLNDIISEHFETNLSWAKVVARKHKKSTCREQRVTHPIPVIPNHYNLLYNDMNGKIKNPQNNAERLRDLNSKCVSRDKVQNLNSTQHLSDPNLQASGSDQKCTYFIQTIVNGAIIANNSDGSISRIEGNMEEFQNTLSKYAVNLLKKEK